MALTRDQQRLVKMDVYIYELNYLYERELQHEQDINKRNLLLSKGIKYRLDKARRARKLLNDSIKNKLTRKNTFSIELAQRKLDVEEAEKELQLLGEQVIIKLGEFTQLKALNIDCSGIEYEYNQLIREIPRQKTRIRNKERALQNWLLGGEKLALRQSSNRLPKEYEPEKDADALFDLLPFDPIRDQVIAFDIRKSPDFNKNPPTDITIDMITPPASQYQQQQDSNVVETTVEEQEERVLAEMHSAKYPTVMID